MRLTTLGLHASPGFNSRPQNWDGWMMNTAPICARILRQLVQTLLSSEMSFVLLRLVKAVLVAAVQYKLSNRRMNFRYNIWYNIKVLLISIKSPDIKFFLSKLRQLLICNILNLNCKTQGYDILNYWIWRYCISRIMIDSLNLSYQHIYHLTLYETDCKKFCPTEKI